MQTSTDALLFTYCSLIKQTLPCSLQTTDNRLMQTNTHFLSGSINISSSATNLKWVICFCKIQQNPERHKNLWISFSCSIHHLCHLHSFSDTSSGSEGEGQGEGDEEEGRDGEEEDGGGGGGTSSSREGSISMEHWITRAIHGTSSTTTTTSSTASSSSSSTRSGGSGAAASRLADVLAQHVHISAQHRNRHHHRHKTGTPASQILTP